MQAQQAESIMMMRQVWFPQTLTQVKLYTWESYRLQLASALNLVTKLSEDKKKKKMNDTGKKLKVPGKYSALGRHRLISTA